MGEKEDTAAEQRVANERTLRETTAFLDSIVENIPDMVFVKDAGDLRFRRFNRAGEHLLGVERGRLLGKNDFDFFPREQAEFFQAKDREVLRGGSVVDIPEEPIDTPKGRRWLHTKKIPILDDDGHPRYLLGISEDITERRAMAENLREAHDELERRVAERTAQLTSANAELERQIRERRLAEDALRASEEQLRQAQKMEAIGRLAGGIAHDFNNLLSIILSYAAMLIDQSEEARAQHDELDEIRRAGERAADLTQQLLAFSRQQVLEPRVINLNETVAQIDKMVRRIIGEDVDLRTMPAGELWNVMVDPGQVEQVVMNLVVNARDAMPAGGTLTIETANIELDSTYALDHPGVNPGPHVMLAVSDSGTGMSKETQARAFEPFFTTKETGRGTGLGLSTVFGIVKQSGGSVWLYSEPGRGTTFKIYFPRTSEVPAAMPARTSPLASGGSETILLVEDEPEVRGVARAALTRRGYRVIEAANANEALEQSETFASMIHMLVTDVVMPGLSGRELAERLTSLRPELCVLYVSGYTDNTIVRHGVLEPGVAFLQKPITPDALTRKVREVLDGEKR